MPHVTSPTWGPPPSCKQALKVPNYKELTDGKFDSPSPPPPPPLHFTSEVLKNLAAEGSSDSESDAVEG